VLALTVEQGSYVHVTPVSFRRSSKPAGPPRGSSALNWYTLPRWTQLPLSACLLVALGLGLEQAATPDWSHLASPCSCHVRATDSAGCSRVCVDGPGPTPKCWSDVRNWRVEFFLFLHFSFLFFLQKYIRKNCITMHLAPWGTAVGTYRRSPSAFLPVGVHSLFKNL
jgi:hypothetical protein